MTDYIYHMTLKVLWNRVFVMQSSRFCHIYMTLLWPTLHNLIKYVTTSGLIFIHRGSYVSSHV